MAKKWFGRCAKVKIGEKAAERYWIFEAGFYVTAEAVTHSRDTADPSLRSG